MGGFLTSAEILTMQSDWVALLGSPEATTAALRWVSGHSGGVWDSDYEKWVGGADTYGTDAAVPCLMNLVRPMDTELLAGGVLKVGDAIFRFEPDYDFSAKSNLEITHRSIVWYPYVDQPTAAQLSTVPLGDSSMAQVLICSQVEPKTK